MRVLKRKIILFKIFLSLLALIYAENNYSQDSLLFENNIYEKAFHMANVENKQIMFYFSSDYCFSCDELDSILNRENLKNYLNTHYINVKIDYKLPLGQRLGKKFNVRVIPSLVFLDSMQQVIFVMGSQLNTGDILNRAKWAISPKSGSEEFYEAYKQKKAMEDGEIIDSVYEFLVVDNYIIEKESAVTLYNQSYMHKAIMDGFMIEHAEKYLSTQPDWSTPKNMEFITEFITDTRSDEFKYLIKHREEFNQLFGDEMIDSLVQKLIEDRLYKVQPEPKYPEVLELMGILSPKYKAKRTYEYLIDLNYRKNRIVEFLYLERKYIKKFAPKDHARMIRMCKIYLDKISEDYNAEYYINTAIIATKINPNIIDYYYTLSRLYLKKRDKCNALKNAVKVYATHIKKGESTEDILKLMLEIDKLHG